MRLSVINAKYERVIQAAFGQLLGKCGYDRSGDQFYLKTGRVGKLLTIQRDAASQSHYQQVILFTIQVYITSDDCWQMNYPGQSVPLFPFANHRYIVLDRHLGQFYGQQRGSQWIALDATLPEHLLIDYLRTLLSTRILPYLGGINTIDDILREWRRQQRSGPGGMLMLAWSGRRQEAYAELQRLLAVRHQKGCRISLVQMAHRLGLL